MSHLESGPIDDLTSVTSKHLNASVFYWSEKPYTTFPWEGSGYYLMSDTPQLLGVDLEAARARVDSLVGDVKRVNRQRFWRRAEEAVGVAGSLWRAWKGAGDDDDDEEDYELPS